MQRGTFKLVEECSGVGELLEKDTVIRQVRYTLARYQGMLEGSGMPVPGLYRVEGSTDFHVSGADARLVGCDLTLRLEDGRALSVTLADADGRIVSVGHGPRGGCSCC